MAELKACPFCGSAAEMRFNEYNDCGRDPEPYQPICSNMDCFCSGGYYKQKEDAVVGWNSRYDDYAALRESHRELLEFAKYVQTDMADPIGTFKVRIDAIIARAEKL